MPDLCDLSVGIDAAWEPYCLHGLGQDSRVGSILGRPCTAPHNVELYIKSAVDDLDRDLCLVWNIKR